MIIAGLQKTTLIDYPGKIACVVFLAGCNFRCPWCYSAELVLPEKILKQHRISEAEIFDFLRKRKGLLEGVVICGGEPTINKDLPQFIEKIKKFNYPVKLDTNGSNPKMLKDLVSAKLIDYVAMDIKAPWALKFEARNSKSEIYEQIMQEGVKMADIEESVEFLKSGKIDFEFRTTVVPGVHKKEDFLEIAKWIGGPEVKYNLQNFRAEKTIDPEFEKIKPYPDAWLKEVVSEISPHFKECRNR
ncbi:MAG: anaerobic ribonucleoside-triphosphate reductase activating protein [Candidatus Staskawiczbacteria bacterium RIFOXYB1_FULL_37_44]|uniref:Anaerobic ribonucleoside-triphosphate reductase activating protein n=1 Tax=Candidatus Staskawiczbacteria bacterium RIFOXYB1_FULL_37_44 TaxID=1802223 RepID=A0A1G2IXI9_9BACT|nr:MAG: anaerobic ribonucleoside-triphosphate reductase activating protein [Candidatus Staskawiczbacteria bacterium RIFOXYB1_FULL_37_44]OGZ88579.1 MAG: anaerobic ribonucleoside-triphosphate reductase activating protein [Candidatus Staskawiczbacteria bacterium RIFOXYC2_FULL_37_19]